EARIADIFDYDPAADLQSAERVLVFWDAHGYDLAIDLLARFFPRLVDKAHLVLGQHMADLSRFDPSCRRHATVPRWPAMGSAPPKFILGDIGSQFEEGIALVDFLGRNGIPFNSAESSYFSDLTTERVAELDRQFGEDFSRLGF